MEPVATEAWATSVVAAWLELPAAQWTYLIMLPVIVLTCLCSLSALACLLPCAISGWLLRHVFACGTLSYSKLDTLLIIWLAPQTSILRVGRLLIVSWTLV